MQLPGPESLAMLRLSPRWKSSAARLKLGPTPLLPERWAEWYQTGVAIPASDFYIELAYANGVWQSQQRVNRDSDWQR